MHVDARECISVLLAGRAESILGATDRRASVLTERVASHRRLKGNPIHDLHISTLMMEDGGPEISTADTDLHQFEFFRVVRPLVES